MPIQKAQVPKTQWTTSHSPCKNKKIALSFPLIFHSMLIQTFFVYLAPVYIIEVSFVQTNFLSTKH